MWQGENTVFGKNSSYKKHNGNVFMLNIMLLNI